MSWYNKTPAEIYSVFITGERGLTSEEVEIRRKQYGENALREQQTDSLLVLFLRQFQSPLIYILVAAAVVVYLLGEATDAYIILGVLLFNAIVGLIQEGKAHQTLKSLQRLVETKATVIRNGEELIINDTELVPGDIVLLIEGSQIPADARLIKAVNLKVTESALTGESEAVVKSPAVILEEDLLVPDQVNMVFKGTHVVTGHGRAVVVATGTETELGKIAEKISKVDTEIPLKKEIRKLSHWVMIAVVIIGVILYVAGVGMGREPDQMLIVVIALAVSLIPEGLPVVLTLILSVGVERMSKRNALVKRLQAVEALGQADVIAVDKTGTITRNEMVVQEVYVGEKFFKIDGSGYDPRGSVMLDGVEVDPLNHQELIFASRVATLCANAQVAFTATNQSWVVSGDPTEAALLVFGEKIGFAKRDLETELPQVGEIPFTYETKTHITLHQAGEGYWLTSVGAPEVVLESCDKVWRNGRHYELTASMREGLDTVLEGLSRKGYRVLAFAVEEHAKMDMLEIDHVKHLTFGGFYAIKDAIRPEVHEAMVRAQAAGIKVVMITGDHKTTAEAIAREATIFKDGDEVLTGAELEALTPEALAIKLDKVSVFARVTPEHKMRIIEAYQRQGKTVAMTGDGVNDAPSLVAADLGVAMGKIGTEVAKDAADIILLDDNFGSIISAIEEGRSIYLTIKKAILYLFSTSIGEMLTIAVALFSGYPLPLLASQIIWLNLVTDGFLTIAWAMEPRTPGLLKGALKRSARQLLDWGSVMRSLLMALVMMAGTLYVYDLYLEESLIKALTMSMTVLAVFQWFNAWNCRDQRESIFSRHIFSNKYLIGATAIVVVLQLVAVYNPFMQKILHTTAISAAEWGVVIVMGLSLVIVEEMRKSIVRWQVARA